jgi:hypothetical protein
VREFWQVINQQEIKLIHIIRFIQTRARLVPVSTTPFFSVCGFEVVEPLAVVAECL